MAIRKLSVVTIKRANTTGNRFDSISTISSNIACTIAPAASEGLNTPFGTFPNYEYLLFVEPDIDIQFKDIIIDEEDDKEYTISGPPRKFRNPITGAWHHIEAEMVPKLG